MLKLSIDKLPQLFEALAAEQDLWLPVRDNDRVEFGPWNPDATVELSGKTGKSGKDFFFPQTEDLVSFQTKGKSISIQEKDRPDAPFVLFGLRGCDAAGMAVLDAVFLAEPRDTFYEARRRAGTLVTLACGDPDETCFCRSFGVDPAAPGGDVDVWLVDGILYWLTKTEKGEALTGKLSGVLEEAGGEGEAAVANQQEDIRRRMDEAPLSSLDIPRVGKEEQEAWFDSPNWARLSESCLGCGTCTFVCPTCQCYDVQDRERGGLVRRFRCWDSCMYSDFTLMAHGNPRTTQMQRFRQRFMHKLVYFPQNNAGTYSCVGCGRCLEKCPSALNIVKVVKTMAAT